jgi:hypothetical protein
MIALPKREARIDRIGDGLRASRFARRAAGEFAPLDVRMHLGAGVHEAMPFEDGARGIDL